MQSYQYAILILYMVLIAKKHAKRKCTLDNDVDPFANLTICIYKVLMYFYNLPCLLEVDSRVLELAVELCPHCLELYVLVSPAVAIAARDDV